MNNLDTPVSPELPAETDSHQMPQMLLYGALGNLVLLSLCLLYFWMRHLQPVNNPFTEPMAPEQILLLFIFLLSATILTALPPLFQREEIWRWLHRPTTNLPPDHEGEIGGELFAGLLTTLAWAGLALYLFINPEPKAAPFHILSPALALSMATLFPIYALYPGNKAFRCRLRRASPWHPTPPSSLPRQLPLEFPQP